MSGPCNHYRCCFVPPPTHLLLIGWGLSLKRTYMSWEKIVEYLLKVGAFMACQQHSVFQQELVVMIRM